jgi:hypothetical protein
MNVKRVALPVTLVALLVAAAPAGAQTRACNPGELGDAKTPAELDGESVGRVDQALVVGRKYRIARVIELAIGRYPDGSPYRQSSAKEGSIAVSAPAGVTLTELPETDSFRGGYEFTAPKGQSVTFTVTWIQELQNQSGTSAGECQATAQITRPIFALKQARVSSVKFVPHRLSRVGRNFFMSDDVFQLVVTPAAAPADPAPVYVVLRVRAGRALAPSANAPPFKRVRLDKLHSINTGGLLLDDYAAEGPGDTFRPGVTVGRTYSRQRSTVRFGFSVEIVQGGRSMGGMRAGATCRFAFSSRAHRHYRRCAVVGFAKHP